MFAVVGSAVELGEALAWREMRLFYLVVGLVVLGLVLGIFLVASALFLQGYFYTEPVPGLPWRGAVTAAVLTLFLCSWCWLNASSSRASPLYVPYDTLFRFSPRVDLVTEPVRKIWVTQRGQKEPTEYRLQKYVQAGQVRARYVETAPGGRPLSPNRIQAIVIEHNGEKLRFEPQAAEDGGYRRFVSDSGWYMPEYEEGPTGIPTTFHTGLFLMNILINLCHFSLWFAGFWLLLRFDWGMSLLLAAAVWLALTVMVLPGLLVQAASLAAPPPAASAPAPPAQV